MGASFAYRFSSGTTVVLARPVRSQSVRRQSEWRLSGGWDALPEAHGDRLPVEMGFRLSREGVPERRLVLAVLLDALQIVAWGVSATQSQRLVAEAREWIMSDDVVWPVSFLNVCEALDLEPRAVRRYAAAWMDGGVNQSRACGRVLRC